MRTVLTMAMKDLRLMSRDWLGLFFILGFPILMALLFGSMYGNIGGGSASLRIAVVDEDDSDVSRQFVADLKDTGNVEIEQLSRDEALGRVRRGQLLGLIALPKGFGETAGIPWTESPAIELGIDPSRRAEAGMLQGLVMQSAGRLMVTRFQDPATMRVFVRQERDAVAQDETISPLMKPVLLEMMGQLDQFMGSWQQVAETERNTAGNSDSAPDGPDFQLARVETIDVTRQYAKDSPEALVKKLRSQWDVSFPQAMLWGILACAAGFAITLVRERKQGTFLRLQIAPVTRFQVLAGKATACFLAVIAVIALMLALGTWMGMRPEQPLLLALAAVCIGFCFTGIMMLMSVIGKTEEAVSGAAWGANMLMAMFGGGMIPLVFMPQFMKSLSNYSPAKWSVLALEGSIWRGFSLAEMVMPCAILVGVGVVAMALGSLLLSRVSD